MSSIYELHNHREASQWYSLPHQYYSPADDPCLESSRSTCEIKSVHSPLFALHSD